MTDTEIRAAIAAERGELAAVLAGLPAAAWDSGTLCAGWRVREVVAHMTMPFRTSVPRFVLGMVKARGNFNRMSDRSARRDATNLSAAALTAMLGDNTGHPWKPPGGGYAGALSHDVIHGLDITVPLGIGRKVPEDRLRPVLDGMTAKTMGYFGVDLTGIQLRADDLDWTRGFGTPLSGAAQDLLLVVCGRRLPPGHLHGEAAGRFTAALT
jgi:uncharacterized protein (TIGR03083 family)